MTPVRAGTVVEIDKAVLRRYPIRRYVLHSIIYTINLTRRPYPVGPSTQS